MGLGLPERKVLLKLSPYSASNFESDTVIEDSSRRVATLSQVAFVYLPVVAEMD